MANYKKTEHDGIRVLPNSISIDFRLKNGTRRRETVKLAPTKKNLKWASRKRETILYEIETNTFNYASHFPNSKWLTKHKLKSSNLRIRDALWSDQIISRTKLEPSTIDGYRPGRNAATEFMGDIQVSSLTITDLMAFEKWLRDERGIVTKTIRNYMIPLIHVAKWAVKEGILANNPFLNFEITMPKKEVIQQQDRANDVDPFDADEVDKILEAIPKEVYNKTLFWLNTGLRTGEIMALSWDKVDWEARTVLISRNITRGKYKLPKTDTVRLVELNDYAYQALMNQREHTIMLPPVDIEFAGSTESLKFIFYYPKNNAPFTRCAQFRRGYWRPTLTKLNMRYRSPYQMRHTYASTCLTIGEDEKWVANQLGHSTVEMIRRHYGSWLKKAAALAGRTGGDKINAYLRNLNTKR